MSIKVVASSVAAGVLAFGCTEDSQNPQSSGPKELTQEEVAAIIASVNLPKPPIEFTLLNRSSIKSTIDNGHESRKPIYEAVESDPEKRKAFLDLMLNDTKDITENLERIERVCNGSPSLVADMREHLSDEANHAAYQDKLAMNPEELESATYTGIFLSLANTVGVHFDVSAKDLQTCIDTLNAKKLDELENADFEDMKKNFNRKSTFRFMEEMGLNNSAVLGIIHHAEDNDIELLRKYYNQSSS